MEFTNKDNELLKVLVLKENLTPKENKQKQFLLDLWQEKQDEKEYKSFCVNCPI